MRSPRYGRILTATVLVSASALLNASAALADPDPQTDQPAPGPGVVAAVVAAPPLDAPPDAAPSSAVPDACKQFGMALDHASSYYEDFAYDSAGGGNSVNYDDPNVANANVYGRTALRESAAAAMSAASAPGLPNDIAAPMRSWSLRATKLLIIMGIRGGGDSLNSTANDMNTDANNVQMACAMNGARA
ncbi:hypothetical protein ACQ86B_18730 [Mycolicibacterium aichiense]|uniref:hypothetical protein n=1 Tax=Mycolicibacterium aichiense TaxID=1799 RepID=UPI003D671468